MDSTSARRTDVSLARATSAQAVDSALVLVPVGSLEQHGPHLPLDTDAAIAEAVCRRVARATPGAWVAPVLPYGSSGEHQSFAGTASVGTNALTHVAVELARSLRTWAPRVVFVNGHGGNVAALSASDEIDWVPCTAPGADLHAGFTETSVMLRIRPRCVRLERAAVGNTQPLRHLLPAMVRGGVAAVSPNGVLGDPTGANAEEGERILRSMVSDVRGRLE